MRTARGWQLGHGYNLEREKARRVRQMERAALKRYLRERYSLSLTSCTDAAEGT